MGGEPFFTDDPALLDDPFAAFARYRRDCPVHRHAPVDQWFVFRHEDVAALLRDPRLSADRMAGFADQVPASMRDALAGTARLFRTWVLMQDGEAHARLRRRLNAGFNASVVKALVPRVEEAADALLCAATGRESFDVCGEYAFRLPAYVLSDFLGVDPADRERVLRWSVDMVDFFNEIPITEDTTRRLVASMTEMEAYARTLIADRAGKGGDDFVSLLVRDRDGEGGLTDDEIVGNAMLLLLAGHIAVRNLVGNAVWLFETHPAEKAKALAGPEALHAAIEEVLRVESPVTLIPRLALEEIMVAGVAIPAGALVQLCLASANRDEARYPDPDRFDVGRHPANVLAFGRGPHGCLGAHLARLIAEVAVRTLYARFPDLALDGGRPITWYRTAANRGPIDLPVVPGPARTEARAAS